MLLLLRLLIRTLAGLLVAALRLLLLGLFVAALASGLLPTTLALVGRLRKYILEKASPAALAFLAHGLVVGLLRLVALELHFARAPTAAAIVIICLTLASGGLLHVAVPRLCDSLYAARTIE